MTSEAKQRAIGIGVSRALTRDVLRGTARLRRSAVALAATTRADLSKMRRAGVLVASARSSAPVASGRVTRAPKLSVTGPFHHDAADLERRTVAERVKSHGAWRAAAAAMPRIAPGFAAFMLKSRGVRRSPERSAKSTLVYRQSSATAEPRIGRLTPSATPPIMLTGRPFDPLNTAWTRVRMESHRSSKFRRLERMLSLRKSARFDALTVSFARALSSLPRVGLVGPDAAISRIPSAPVQAGPAALLPQDIHTISPGSGGAPAPAHMQIGRWVTDYLTEAAMRPPSGVSGLDDRLTPIFAGMLGSN